MAMSQLPSRLEPDAPGGPHQRSTPDPHVVLASERDGTRAAAQGARGFARRRLIGDGPGSSLPQPAAAMAAVASIAPAAGRNRKAQPQSPRADPVPRLSHEVGHAGRSLLGSGLVGDRIEE